MKFNEVKYIKYLWFLPQIVSPDSVLSFFLNSRMGNFATCPPQIKTSFPISFESGWPCD